MSLMISLSPDQVEQRLTALGLHTRFTESERQRLQTTPVVDRVERVFGFPTPADNANLTLRKIKEAVGVDPKHPPSFFEHPWYEAEQFLDTPCPPGWHLLTMDPLPESIQQPAAYLRSSRFSMLELPLAVEVVLMLFIHHVGTREQLLLRKHTWCSDMASLDRQVTVGAFGRNGVFLSGHPLNFSSQGLGVCAKTPVKG